MDPTINALLQPQQRCRIACSGGARGEEGRGGERRRCGQVGPSHWLQRQGPPRHGKVYEELETCIAHGQIYQHTYQHHNIHTGNGAARAARADDRCCPGPAITCCCPPAVPTPQRRDRRRRCCSRRRRRARIVVPGSGTLRRRCQGLRPRSPQQTAQTGQEGAAAQQIPVPLAQVLPRASPPTSATPRLGSRLASLPARPLQPAAS